LATRGGSDRVRIAFESGWMYAIRTLETDIEDDVRFITQRRNRMRKFIAYSVAAVLAVGFGLFSIQGVRADEKKPAPALEVAAGSAAQMHNAEGIKHYNAGHMDVAAKHFEEAVQADDKSAEAHYNHALALDGMGDHKAATQEFSRALELAPKNPAIADSAILKAHLERMKK